MNKNDKIIVVALFVLLGAFLLHNMQRSGEARREEGDKQTGNGEQIETGDGDAADPDDDAQAGTDDSGQPDTTPEQPEQPEQPGTTDADARPQTASRAFRDLPEAEPVQLHMGQVATLTIDPERGGVTSVRLHKHNLTKDSEANMVLGDETHPLLAIQRAPAEDEEGEDQAQAAQFSHARIVNQTERELHIERQLLGTDLVIAQRWRLAESDYRLEYDVSCHNAGDQKEALAGLELRAGLVPPLETPKPLLPIFRAGSLDQSVSYRATDGDSERMLLKEVVTQEDEDRAELAGLPLTWLATHNKFFACILSDRDGEALTGCRLTAPLIGDDVETAVDGDADEPPRYAAGLVALHDGLLEPGEKVVHRYDFYVGPKVYDRLEALGAGQEHIMQFDRFLFFRVGVMRWISLSIFWLITSFYSLIGNCGIAIVLTTIVVRTVFLPISYRSTVWSEKMKELQPEMKKIQEKYASDPQMKGQKTMELYREHKVSPIGGCLPMFFQIPVFFALFSVLRNAIELRHAEFFLWINDLSMPDALFNIPEAVPFVGDSTFNVLPFLMAGAMFTQQKLMPTSADPMQQKMMLFMCVFILLVCYSMPSGLTLYWTVSNIFTIGQYKIIHSMVQKKKANKENQKQREKGQPA
jgi:YidC/Oxa1 family membrane protein insertase